MKTIILARHTDDGVQTLGDLTIESFMVFKTLERPWKNNAPNISCIPKGIYQCDWTFSPKLLRSTYQIMKVPGRSGIRFHPGNYFFDIEGCILLGTGYMDLNHDGKLDIINSKVSLKSFETFLNKESFLLKIV